MSNARWVRVQLTDWDACNVLEALGVTECASLDRGMESLALGV